MNAPVSSPVVRRADLTGSDAAVVSRLVEAYLRETEAEKAEWLGEPSRTGRLPDGYRRELESPSSAYQDSTVLLAELSGIPVGVAVVTPVDDASEVKRVWVDPDARGHRVGSALLDAAIVQHGGTVRLTVWDWRTGAIRLYASRGFVPVPSWDERERLLCMEKV